MYRLIETKVKQKMQIRKKIFPVSNYDHGFLGYCRGKKIFKRHFSPVFIAIERRGLG